MASVDNQQSWLPYDGAVNKDCTQGFCSIYCPQWCYVLFPPPPPLSLAGADDGSGTTFSPLVIAIIAILATALLVVSYYTFVNKYCASLCFQRRPFHLEEDTSVTATAATSATAAGSHEEYHVSPANGLEEELINKITVLRYKKEEGIVDGSDCSVCLGEFREEDSLRLLPKCNHAFHLLCIDTWLKSHANCPLCRAFIAMEPEEKEEEISLSIEEEPEEEEEGHEGTDTVEIGEEEAESVRWCYSMGSPSNSGRVSIADVLQISMEEEYLVAKDCGLVAGAWSCRRIGGEPSKEGGRSRGLHCVLSPVRMKRSVSNGRSFFVRQGRGRTSLLPV